MHLEQTRNIPREIAEAGRLSHLFLPWVAPARRYSTRPPLPLVILAERGDALQHLPRLGFWQASETVAGCCPVFSTGQSVRPGPGPGRTTLCRPPSSSGVFRCFPPPPAVLYLKLSRIVKLVVHNDGRPGSSRTRADYLVPSRLVRGSWQSPRRALPGPWTVENTAGPG